MNLLEGREASTAETIFQSVDELLERNGINWNYCVAIGLGNTNVNLGDHNSIKSRAKEKNGDIIISGCPCQILHNASGIIVITVLTSSTGSISPANGRIS